MSGAAWALVAAASCALPPLVLTRSVPTRPTARRSPGPLPVPAVLRRARARVRERELAEEATRLMPTLIDVVSLGLSAGLSFDASLELYCARFDNPLAKEFSQTMLLWQMGVEDRRQALAGMAQRLGSPAIGRFADAVGEAITFGTPLAAVLEHQATALRDEHRRAMEEQVERAPVKMLIPLGTLIVPAMLLSIMGPLLSSVMGVGT